MQGRINLPLSSRTAPFRNIRKYWVYSPGIKTYKWIASRLETLTSIVWPVNVFHRLKMLVGNAAEPETTSRIFSIAMEGFKVSGSCGRTSSIFANIVGTPIKSVNRVSFLFAKRSQTLMGLKRINSTLAPDHTAQLSLLITPCTWWRGRKCRIASLCVHPHDVIRSVIWW